MNRACGLSGVGQPTVGFFLKPPSAMRAMLLDRERVNVDGAPALRLAEMPVPEPAQGEVLVRVNVCGVCRTDLDLVEGRLAAPRYPIIPGHQIVGRVER